jgi:hypothetical protein
MSTVDQFPKNPTQNTRAKNDRFWSFQKGPFLAAFSAPILVKNDVASLAERGSEMINKRAKLDRGVAL